jgi:cupin fold WbuC family metalloprotein
MKIIDNAVLDAVSAAAQQSPRLRMNHNLHPSDSSACHRFFNAIEPGSYIRPHCHQDPEKDETLVMIRGSLGIVRFDASGTVTASFRLAASGDKVAVDIPSGVYHSAVSLESGTIFLEVKAGPYLPLSAEEKAPFAPEEGSPEVAAYLEQLRGLFD